MSSVPLLRCLLSVAAMVVTSFTVAHCSRKGLSVVPENAPVVPDQIAMAPDPYAADPHTCTSELDTQALATVNADRAAAGAEPLRCLPELTTLADEHAHFLAANEGLPLSDLHAEVPGEPGFTGSTLADREATAGLDRANFWLSEGVGGAGSASTIVEAHIGTVYHRSGLLTPAGRYFGIADEDAKAPHIVIESLAANTGDHLTPALYPGRAQTGVPPAFSPFSEVPNPVPTLTHPGYPISVHFPRLETVDDTESMATGTLTVAAASGGAIAGILITPASDPELSRGDIVFVPAAPLAAATAYTVTANATYGSQTLATSWNFTTR